MATKKVATKKAAKPPTPKPASEPERPNREQRRREKFGHAGGATKDLWPQSEANPALGRIGQPSQDTAAHTGTPDQDVTHQTGPGTGGATEGDDRVVEREGIHGSNTQKS
jgi:outer membrane biosynthesis protein TonB